MELPRHYPYNPRRRTIFYFIILSGVFSPIAANQAIHNHAGLIIDGFIRFGPDGATAFYWIFTALGSLIGVTGILMAWRRIAHPKIFALEQEAFVLPHGFMQMKTARILYSEIQKLSEAKISGQFSLAVTARGQEYSISASLFPDPASYLAVRDFLISSK